MTSVRCRICFKLNLALSCKYVMEKYNESAELTILEMLIFCVPQLQSSLLADDCICLQCLGELNSCVKFIKRCIETDNLHRNDKSNKNSIVFIDDNSLDPLDIQADSPPIFGTIKIEDEKTYPNTELAEEDFEIKSENNISEISSSAETALTDDESMDFCEMVCDSIRPKVKCEAPEKCLCDHCGQDFISVSILRTHMITAHKDSKMLENREPEGESSKADHPPLPFTMPADEPSDDGMPDKVRKSSDKTGRHQHCLFCSKEVVSKYFVRHLQRRHSNEDYVKNLMSLVVGSSEHRTAISALIRQTDFMLEREKDSLRPLIYLTSDSEDEESELLQTDEEPEAQADKESRVMQPDKKHSVLQSDKESQKLKAHEEPKILQTDEESQALQSDDKSRMLQTRSLRNREVSIAARASSEKPQNHYKSPKRLNRHGCYFCGKSVSNFARHLQRHHAAETEVKEAYRYPQDSKERRSLLILLRNKGNYLRSKIVGMRTSPGTKVVRCNYCYGGYSQRQLWRHKRKCLAKQNTISDELYRALKKVELDLNNGVFDMKKQYDGGEEPDKSPSKLDPNKQQPNNGFETATDLLESESQNMSNHGLYHYKFQAHNDGAEEQDELEPNKNSNKLNPNNQQPDELYRALKKVETDLNNGVFDMEKRYDGGEEQDELDPEKNSNKLDPNKQKTGTDLLESESRNMENHGLYHYKFQAHNDGGEEQDELEPDKNSNKLNPNKQQPDNGFETGTDLLESERQSNHGQHHDNQAYNNNAVDDSLDDSQDAFLRSLVLVDLLCNNYIEKEKNKDNTKSKRLLVPWTEEQKQVVCKFFAEHIKEKTPPRKSECVFLKEKHPELLRNKDWVKIKVFVQNLYTKKLKMDPEYTDDNNLSGITVENKDKHLVTLDCQDFDDNVKYVGHDDSTQEFKSVGKNKRILVPWSKEQKNVVIQFFDHHIKNKKPPKREECEILREEHPVLLENKDWLKIKVFVQNVYTSKTKGDSFSTSDEALKRDKA